MKILNLIKSEALKYIAELKRYLFNTVSSLIGIYMIFLAFFFGFKFFAGPNFSGDKLDSFIVGYIMWMFALIGFQSVSYALYEEMQKGTLEQVYLSSLGLEWVLFIRMVFEFLFSLLFNTIILFLTMVTTGRWFSLPAGKLILTLIVSLPSLWGLGLIFAGITLCYKRTTAFLQIITFLLIGAVAVDAYPINPFSFLPFSAGASTIQDIINDQATFPFSWYLFLIFISILYLSVGIGIFKIYLKKARKGNLLGQY